MLPATIGILSLSAVIFLLGMLSARRAARIRHKEAKESMARDSRKQLERLLQDKNRENPDAMAMAGSAGMNSVK